MWRGGEVDAASFSIRRLEGSRWWVRRGDYGERSLMARCKADWVWAESEGASLETTDFGRENGSTGTVEMPIRAPRCGRRHTNAWACIEHAVRSQIFCSAKRNREQDIAEEAPLL